MGGYHSVSNTTAAFLPWIDCIIPFVYHLSMVARTAKGLMFNTLTLIGCGVLLATGSPAPAQADVGGVGASPPPVSVEKREMRRARAAKTGRRRGGAAKTDAGAAPVTAIPPAVETAEPKKETPAEAPPAATSAPAAPEEKKDSSPKPAEGPLLIDNTPKDKSAKLPETAAGADKTAATVQEPTPLLVISFNSKHTYYDRSLEKAIRNAERESTGASYQIVSLVPVSTASKTKNERLADEYNSNVNGVIQKFAEYGVQPFRVQASTKTSDKVTFQTINIYKQ
jgi:hypothetical protein